MKVYCKNCTHRKWLITHEHGLGDGNWVCEASCYDGQLYNTCMFKNPTGECNNYKRKWWKFWIKEATK